MTLTPVQVALLKRLQHYRERPPTLAERLRLTLAPDGAPDWVYDRLTLWNTVDAVETRKDAQLARDIEIGLPIELKESEQIALARDFARREFVAKGMVADFAVHLDNPQNPHAHILLSTRDLTETGFGYKNRSWNAKSELLAWCRGWAEVTNEHLIEAGLGVRIDHRSYKDQKLDLIPGRKIGLSKERQTTPDLPGFLADRVEEQQRIAGANGVQIIAEPTIALKALSHTNATFSHHDIAKFLHTRTENAEQFETAYLKVTASPDIVPLGTDDLGRQRFTTREMFDLERSLLDNADGLANRKNHGVNANRRAAILAKHTLSPEQQRAALEVTGQGDLKSLAGVAGSGKSTTLAAMREIWEAEGYTVKGAALAGIAAENLEYSSGIKARTLASYELAWERGRDPLNHRDVLVVDEAGMIGTRQLERVISAANKAHAKVVLVGDAEQLQAIEAGAAFRGLATTHGVSNLTEVRRQRSDWQRTATQNLSTGNTTVALNAYTQHGHIVAVEKREDARNALIARWAHDHKQNPQVSQLVLAYTRDDVNQLNTSIRTLRHQTGQLGEGEVISTERGKKPFAVNDRIRFLRNERDLGVKNGSLGTVEGIESGVLTIKLDGAAGTRVIDTKFYQHLDYGYAATVHKAQGTTVDKTYVLATPTSIATRVTSRSPAIATTPRCSTPPTISAAAPTARRLNPSKRDSPTRCREPGRKNSPTTTWSASRLRTRAWSPAWWWRNGRRTEAPNSHLPPSPLRHRPTTSRPANRPQPSGGRRDSINRYRGRGRS
jgi:Ti-type conjugative transfer relaxase TraA